jgi:hypothetical protein
MNIVSFSVFISRLVTETCTGCAANSQENRIVSTKVCRFKVEKIAIIPYKKCTPFQAGNSSRVAQMIS